MMNSYGMGMQGGMGMPNVYQQQMQQQMQQQYTQQMYMQQMMQQQQQQMPQMQQPQGGGYVVPGSQMAQQMGQMMPQQQPQFQQMQSGGLQAPQGMMPHPMGQGQPLQQGQPPVPAPMISQPQGPPQMSQILNTMRPLAGQGSPAPQQQPLRIFGDYNKR